MGELKKKTKESEGKYRILVENAKDWIWILDKEGNFTFFNKAAERESGYKFKEWKDKSFEPIIVPEDLPHVKNIFAKTLKGESHTYDARIYNSKGKILILEINTAPIKKEGKIVGTMSFGRDVTEYVKAKEKLKASEEKYRTLTENINTGIYRNTGLEGKFIEANPAIIQMFGYDSKENFLKTSAVDLYQNTEDRKKFNLSKI